MKKKTIIFITFIFALVIFLGGQSTRAFAQASQTPTPTPTPNVMSTLQAVVATQQVLTNDLTHKVDNAVQDQQTDARDFRSQFGIIYAGATLLTGLLGFLGWKTLKDIRDDFKSKMATEREDLSKEMHQSFEKELYQLDLANLDIFIIWNEDMPPVARRLELSGFDKNIKQIKHLTQEIEHGIIIARAFGDEEAQQVLLDIQNLKLNPKKLALILYTSSHKISENTQKQISDYFENWTFANFPATVVSSVLVVGRGLKPDFPPEKS